MSSVLVDLYKLKNRHSGLGEFSFQFHKHLTGAGTQNLDITFLQARKAVVQTTGVHTYRSVSLQKRYAPGLTRNFNLWHSLHQFPSHKPNGKTPWLLTIHDLNFLTEKKEGKAQRYLKQLQKNVDRADCISTISHYTAGQLKEHLDLKGKEPVVIHNGVELQIFPDATLPEYASGQAYFFSIGIFSAKKNFKVLLPLLEHFPEHKLIIAGNHETGYGTEVKRLIQDLKLQEKVILPGRISNDTKYALYKNCRAFLFPSLAEGFGLPVIEAMLAGAPVFLSTFSSLPEIGGKHAFYWNKLEAEAMASELKKQLSLFENDLSHQKKLLQNYAQQFSWPHCIEAYLHLYRSILS